LGVYSEYINAGMLADFAKMEQERKKQLQRISELRGRDVLVYAADLNAPPQADISVTYGDLLPISDQLSDLEGVKVDLILETPGGSGEVAEDIVDVLHKKYDEVGVIVPGTAKSAGTLMVMAANEILVSPASSLGPIDAQIQWQGKVFSADALLEGMEAIKEEVDKKGELNRAYIPILQGISPGELQHAENSLEFARKLVTDWLARFKFKNWEVHSSTGKKVTNDERKKRAREVGELLCDHGHWLTHGRSIKIEDLEKMRLLITNYEDEPDLSDAIRRYHTLLQMTFAGDIYKVFETPTAQVYRALAPAGGAPFPPPPPGAASAKSANVEFPCSNCQMKITLQANFEEGVPLKEGALAFPPDNKVKCSNCGAENDVTLARLQIEAQIQRPIVVEGGGGDEQGEQGAHD
jgi:hypothetical protein